MPSVISCSTSSREPERFGLDLDIRQRELRQDVEGMSLSRDSPTTTSAAARTMTT
jgi:hypothetical protein